MSSFRYLEVAEGSKVAERKTTLFIGFPLLPLLPLPLEAISGQRNLLALNTPKGGRGGVETVNSIVINQLISSGSSGGSGKSMNYGTFRSATLPFFVGQGSGSSGAPVGRWARDLAAWAQYGTPQP